jgi:diguanylate cyclase (GGDEF)-like protein
LTFLGVAVAAIPVVTGIRVLLGGDVDGLLLTVGGALVATLVMFRIGLLAAERVRAERALAYQAAHDPLTHLLNRRAFIGRLGREMARGTDSVILFIDLDDFKAINDRFGHAAGDKVLVEVGQRLRRCVGDTDAVSRFGGDEFLILLTNATRADGDAACECIAAALSRPIDLAEGVPVDMSIGVVVATGEVSPEEVIMRADRAMYHAKASSADATSDAHTRSATA